MLLTRVPLEDAIIVYRTTGVRKYMLMASTTSGQCLCALTVGHLEMSPHEGATPLTLQTCNTLTKFSILISKTIMFLMTPLFRSCFVDINNLFLLG